MWGRPVQHAGAEPAIKLWRGLWPYERRAWGRAVRVPCRVAVSTRGTEPDARRDKKNATSVVRWSAGGSARRVNPHRQLGSYLDLALRRGARWAPSMLGGSAGVQQLPRDLGLLRRASPRGDQTWSSWDLLSLPGLRRYRCAGQGASCTRASPYVRGADRGGRDDEQRATDALEEPVGAGSTTTL